MFERVFEDDVALDVERSVAAAADVDFFAVLFVLDVSEDFFDDLALVLGVGPQTEEDDMEASALAFLQNHNIVGPRH